MVRTIVCKKCDNNEVIIEKVRQQVYIKCSKCGSVIIQAMHLESWDKDVTNIYKLRINIKNDRLIEADIIERDIDNKESKIIQSRQTKIRFMYIKEYQYIRQLEGDEYMEMCYLNTQIHREIHNFNETESKNMAKGINICRQIN